MGLKLFNLYIPYYGFCIAIGIVISFLTGFLLCKKNKLSSDLLLIIFAYLISFGFFGAKLLYIIVTIKYINFSQIFSSLSEFMDFMSAGFVFYGGLIGGFAALLLVKKIHHIEIKEYLNIIVICLAICHGFGRIGCSLAGCCYGKETSLPFYFLYKESFSAPCNVRLFPTQGIESAFIFTLAIIMLILYCKNKNIVLWPVYFISYTVLRFILEFFRGDVIRGKIGILSTSQFISLAIFFLIIFYLIFKKIFAQKKNNQ